MRQTPHHTPPCSIGALCAAGATQVSVRRQRARPALPIKLRIMPSAPALRSSRASIPCVQHCRPTSPAVPALAKTTTPMYQHASDARSKQCGGASCKYAARTCSSSRTSPQPTAPLHQCMQLEGAVPCTRSGARPVAAIEHQCTHHVGSTYTAAVGVPA
jgi:hypothetical protein